MKLQNWTSNRNTANNALSSQEKYTKLTAVEEFCTILHYRIDNNKCSINTTSE